GGAVARSATEGVRPAGVSGIASGGSFFIAGARTPSARYAGASPIEGEAGVMFRKAAVDLTHRHGVLLAPALHAPFRRRFHRRSLDRQPDAVALLQRFRIPKAHHTIA